VAEATGHKFGQIIGEVIEVAVYPLLSQFAKDHNLYLDKAEWRPARKGKKVLWKDLKGNSHDLDFVLEKGGSDQVIGRPVAFIETAWRRYTKHSRNKAQEIQGAILPLVEAHSTMSPFIGAVLAGVFTDGALAQMRSWGIRILYFPYESVLKAFSIVGIDANFDEQTSDIDFSRKLRAWEQLSTEKRSTVARKLVDLNRRDIDDFFADLKIAVTREIETIHVLPLHGKSYHSRSLEEAISFIDGYNITEALQVLRYEIEVRYNNGDLIRGQFLAKDEAIRFLRSFEPPPISPVIG
jgi:hypothetical protein